MFHGPVLFRVRLPLTKLIRSRVIPFLCALTLLSTMTQLALAVPPPDAQAKRSPLLAALQAELERSMKSLSALDPPAYYMGYTITESQRADVSGSNGALLNSNEARNRWLEVSVRTGKYELDNSHKVGERQQPSGGVTPVPIDDDAEVVRRAIWLETDKQYRAASEALIKIKTGKEIKVDIAKRHAPDFSREEAHTSIGPQASIAVDRKPWEEKVRAYTKAFRESPAIINSIVTFSAQAQNAYQVTSEGTQLQFGQIRYRLELFIQGKAPDGMDIDRYYNFDWVDSKDAPDDKAVYAAEATMRKELEGLVAAPNNDPTVGPALLTGRAAAVFFHEVFGHRAEGHRQKDVSEGQTFSKKVGEQILPEFLSITDDTTMKKLGKQDLLGYYQFDDEGVPAQRVSLVEHGVLKNFEMSRSPLVGFPRSNGHCRRQLGATPVSRQGNLIGLLIDDIAGGFTFTGRGQPQAFQVLPLVVYKVYADGRPDELVRGVDIVGTPLAALTKIV